MNAVSANIQKGKGSVGGFVANPELRNDAKAAMDSFQEFSAKVNSNHSTAARLLNGSLSNNAALNDATAKMGSISKDIQDGKGTVGKAMQDAAFRANVSSASSNTQAMLSDMNAGKGAVGMLSDPAFAKNVSDTRAQFNAFSAGIGAGKGTIGKLAKDDAVSAQLKKLGTESNALAEEIRKDPKHTISIEFRIF
jgi:phospholipid/cholesterol/gamma-HCH transport system substrate-binding protein